MHQLPSLVLLGQAHALEAAAEGVVPAENIHSAVEPGGGGIFLEVALVLYKVS